MNKNSSRRFTQISTDQKTKKWAASIFILICVYLRDLWLVLFPSRRLWLALACLTLTTAVGCQREPAARRVGVGSARPLYKSLPANSPPDLKRFINAAVAQVGVTTSYDPAYVQLDYPGGDVPKERGVCTDVLVRAMRGVNIDLQKEVHEDMLAAWSAYPKRWGLSGPDSNIDHRRVPNLMTYFARKGKSVSITDNADDYRPGDIVTWDLGGGVDHIGVVTDMALTPAGPPLIVHNIGAGARVEEVLFDWKITGHYRYF